MLKQFNIVVVVVVLFCFYCGLSVDNTVIVVVIRFIVDSLLVPFCVFVFYIAEVQIGRIFRNS